MQSASWVDLKGRSEGPTLVLEVRALRERVSVADVLPAGTSVETQSNQHFQKSPTLTGFLCISVCVCVCFCIHTHRRIACVFSSLCLFMCDCGLRHSCEPKETDEKPSRSTIIHLSREIHVFLTCRRRKEFRSHRSLSLSSLEATGTTKM